MVRLMMAYVSNIHEGFIPNRNKVTVKKCTRRGEIIHTVGWSLHKEHGERATESTGSGETSHREYREQEERATERTRSEPQRERGASHRENEEQLDEPHRVAYGERAIESMRSEPQIERRVSHRE